MKRMKNTGDPFGAATEENAAVQKRKAKTGPQSRVRTICGNSSGGESEAPSVQVPSSREDPNSKHQGRAVTSGSGGKKLNFSLSLLYTGTWRRGDLKKLEILEVRRHVAAFRLGDISPSSKARSCPRTPYFHSQFAFMREFKQKWIAGRSPTLPTFPTLFNLLNVLNVPEVLKVRNWERRHVQEICSRAWEQNRCSDVSLSEPLFLPASRRTTLWTRNAVT